MYYGTVDERESMELSGIHEVTIHVSVRFIFKSLTEFRRGLSFKN